MPWIRSLVETEEELETLDAAAGPQQHHYPSFAELSAFLQRRCRNLRSLGMTHQPKQTGNAVRASVPSTSNPRGVKAFATTTLKCSACDGPHYLGHCPRFKGQSAGERRDLVAREQLCFNCLRQEHRAESCPSQSSCRTCGSQHHTLLHGSSEKRSNPSDESGHNPKRARRDDRGTPLSSCPVRPDAPSA